MEIGLNLYSIRNLIGTEEGFLKTAEELKKMGYSYMQFSGSSLSWEAIKRVCEASGMPVYLTHMPMDRILNDTERLMEEHAGFGCKNIGLGAMPLPVLIDERACKAKIGELERTAEKMERAGFKFFYHHHHFEFLKYGNQTIFDYMLENAPHINFTVDTYWLQYGGADVLGFLDKLNGRMECVHLKDYKIGYRTGHENPELFPEFAALGDGTLDFRKIVEKMRLLGAKYFFVEQDNAAELPDRTEQIARSAQYAKKEL